MQAIKQILGCAGLMGFGLLSASAACAQQTTFPQIQRGRYLSQVGDCVSCHTAKGGKRLAGGFPIDTPFGVIYSTNITPDPDTGIGKWSDQDFYNAMHKGVRPDGNYLYPAFPYPWFTKMSRSDVLALKAYLDTVEPVKQENKANELPWPLSWRPVMAGWNLLFFHEGSYQPDQSKSYIWNRGAYLIQGPAHCAACHTPKNMFGAPNTDQAFQGGSAGESWFAPSLGSGQRDGIGGWTTQEIIQYLKTGANHETMTAGPMTDVVVNSTQYFSNTDLRAVATFLQDIPPSKNDADSNKVEISQDAMARGHAVYMDNCIGCHMANGGGLKDVFPPLKDSASIQAEKATSLIHVVLSGEKRALTQAKPTGLAMPAFGWLLDDQEVADLINYIRNDWGNRAALVDSDAVADVRADARKYDEQRDAPLPVIY